MNDFRTETLQTTLISARRQVTPNLPDYISDDDKMNSTI